MFASLYFNIHTCRYRKPCLYFMLSRFVNTWYFCYSKSDSQLMAAVIYSKVNIDFCRYYVCFFVALRRDRETIALRFTLILCLFLFFIEAIIELTFLRAFLYKKYGHNIHSWSIQLIFRLKLPQVSLRGFRTSKGRNVCIFDTGWRTVMLASLWPTY